MFYAVEFPSEDKTTRGPYVVPQNKVNEEDNCTRVLWNVVDDNGDVREVYFDASKLKQGSKKECSEFIDRLKKSRETAEVFNKERSRKKPSRLDDYEADDIYEPPLKKQATTVKDSHSESDEEEAEEDGDIFLEKLKEKARKKKQRQANGFSRQNRGQASTMSKPKDSADKKSAFKEKKINEKVAQKKAKAQAANSQSSEITKNLPLQMKVHRQDDSDYVEFFISVTGDMNFGNLRGKIAKATRISLKNLMLVVRGEEWKMEEGENIKERWSPEDIVAAIDNAGDDNPPLNGKYRKSLLVSLVLSLIFNRKLNAASLFQRS